MNRRALFSFLSAAPAAAAAGIAASITPKPTRLDIGNYEIVAVRKDLYIQRTDIQSKQKIIIRVGEDKDDPR